MTRLNTLKLTVGYNKTDHVFYLQGQTLEEKTHNKELLMKGLNWIPSDAKIPSNARPVLTMSKAKGNCRVFFNIYNMRLRQWAVNPYSVDYWTDLV